MPQVRLLLDGCQWHWLLRYAEIDIMHGLHSPLVKRGAPSETGISPAVEGFYAEINGIKQILVSLEAEIFADQHIQNPLKSASGKSC